MSLFVLFIPPGREGGSQPTLTTTADGQRDVESQEKTVAGKPQHTVMRQLSIGTLERMMDTGGKA